MRKILGAILFSLFLLPSLGLANVYKDCFPSADETAIVLREASLRNEISQTEGTIMRKLAPSERIRILNVRVIAAIQIWAEVQTQANETGWVLAGYFSDVIHGHAAFCAP